MKVSGTRRQQMLALLRLEPLTLRDLATEFRMPIKLTAHELEHVARSAAPDRLIVERPSRCLRCDYEFRNRRRLTTPSRCPQWRSEKTTEPVFRIG